MLDKFLLNLYIFTTFLFLPLFKVAVKRRLRLGKEHSTRWKEKLGAPSIARPSGKLVWLHAVGLGEVLALRGLIEKLHDKEESLNFLVTSSTIYQRRYLRKINRLTLFINFSHMMFQYMVNVFYVTGVLIWLCGPSKMYGLAYPI